MLGQVGVGSGSAGSGGHGAAGKGTAWWARRGMIIFKKRTKKKMENTKKHPAWKNAIEKIVDRFETEGYGVTFSQKDLLKWFDLKKPEIGTHKQFADFQFGLLTHMENTKKELLTEYNLCLEPAGSGSYKLMHPKDQVTLTAAKYMRKARLKINQAVQRLMHVDDKALDVNSAQARLQSLGRAAFIRSAMNKRKVPINGGSKKIENKSGNNKK